MRHGFPAALVPLCGLLTASLAAAQPARETSLAVLPVATKVLLPKGLPELIHDHLLEEVRREGSFGRVLSPSEMADLMSPEARKTIMECASDECAVVDNEIAGALGATHLMSLSVAYVEKTYMMTLKVFELRSGLVLGAVSGHKVGGSASALVDGIPGDVIRVLADAGFTKRATVAVFPLVPRAGVTPMESDEITREVARQLRRYSAFAYVMEPAELSGKLSREELKTVTSCAEDECSVIDQELLGNLRATHVLVGGLGKVGGDLSVSVKLVETRTALVLASLSRRSPVAGGLRNAAEEAIRSMLTRAKMAELKAGQDTEDSSRVLKWKLTAVVATLAGAVALPVTLVLAGAFAISSVVAWVPQVRTPVFAALGLDFPNEYSFAVVQQGPWVALGALTAVGLLSVLAASAGVTASVAGLVAEPSGG